MSISDNLHQVKQRVEKAAKKAGRNPDEVKLVAVSKNKTSNEIREAFGAGQRIFGENYAQEFISKFQELSDLEIEWHFIGHLQRNKVKSIIDNVSMIQSLNSSRLAEAIDKKSEKPIKCLLEVNICKEETKSGIDLKEISNLISSLADKNNINLVGLMTMPPFFDDQEETRPYFRKLKTLLDEINEKGIYKNKLTELSMGMSGDFQLAIEEGATIVRIGSAIFGERSYK